MPETHDGEARTRPGAGRARLSPMQAGMLYHHLSGAPADVDLQQIVVTLPEPIDAARLAAAWDRIVAHVPALRTSVDWRDPARASRVVHDDLRVPMVTHELAGDRDAAVGARIDAHRARGFDPATPPLARIELIRTPDGVSTLLWSFHHLVMDGRSTAVVLLDLFDAYEALGRGDEVALPERPPYERYLDWLDARDGARDAEFWRTRLAGLETATPAPGSCRKSDRASGGRLDETERRLGAGTTDRIERFAAEHDTSVNAIVQAAWALVLATFSGSSDVVYGITRAVRPDDLDDADAFIGVLIQTHPVRVRVDPDRPVSAWLSDLRAAHREMADHWLAPLADIQTWSDVPPGAPLFETLYMYDRVEMGDALAAVDPAWAARTVKILERPPYPMTLYAFGRPELLLRIDADPDRIEPGTGARLLDLLAQAIERIAAGPERPVGSIGLLSDRARARILDTWNETERPVEDRPFAHEAVRDRAADRGAEVALVEGDRELTYAELADAVARAAAGMRALGVGPGAVVGLHGDRSIETITALLAVLDVGAAYLPLDPTYPSARLRFMAEDAGLHRVVEGPGAHVAWGDDVVVTRVEALGGAAAEPDGADPHAVRADDLAYLIYTSGSTGRPKGVMIEHGNLRNFLEAMDPVVDGPPGTWLSATPLSFDISVLEILWTLARGWTVVLPDPMPGPATGGRSERATNAAPAAGAGPAASPSGPPAAGAVPFGLFYFAAASGGEGRDAYRLLLEGARFAEARGFRAIWTPERHFHAFGGLYPDPAVTGAAVAAIAPNVCVRAGSVVLPLHDPIRVAEAWAVLDNLTNGRAGVAFASGWQRNDFVLSPDHYEDRHEEMLRGIDIVQRLWRGEEVFRPGVGGESVGVRLHPRPIQPALPMWLTAAGSPETFRRAGEIGAGVLTHLLGQSLESLAELVGAYREAWQRAGHGPGPGHVVAMLHTFVGDDEAEVRELVAPPLKAYLRTSVSLIRNYSGVWASRSRPGGEKPKGDEFEQLSEEDLDALLDRAFDRYYEESGLLGPPGKCAALVESLRAVGVDEIACLVDFGVDVERTLSGLEDLDELRRRFDPDAAAPRAGTVPSGPADPVDGSGSAGPAGEGAKLGARVAGVPELILRRKVTHLQCTPSVIRMLLADPDGRRALARLELVLVGGEALPGGLARDLREATDAGIRNMYGPTETTVWSTTAPVTGDEDGIVPIGRPIANTRVYVLDARREPLPEGAPGELWIGGAGVARGYHDRSALTAERFVHDPFAGAGARMYRTGDRVRWRPDGTLEFLGRVDQQVKLRGHRIELGEIEAALRLNPGVEAAAVVVRGEGAGARLTAYTVGPASVDALRPWLAERLPDAMIPDDWSVLDALPLTPNGKVDRRRLPDPRRGAAAAAAPSGTSDTLAAIWSRVLGLDEVGPEEDFFALGGNSLSTIQVAFEIREAFGIELPLRAFFRAPTVRALAELVEAELVSRAAGEDLDSLIDELSALSDEEARRLVERE